MHDPAWCFTGRAIKSKRDLQSVKGSPWYVDPQNTVVNLSLLSHDIFRVFDNCIIVSWSLTYHHKWLYFDWRSHSKMCTASNNDFVMLINSRNLTFFFSCQWIFLLLSDPILSLNATISFCCMLEIILDILILNDGTNWLKVMGITYKNWCIF